MNAPWSPSRNNGSNRDPFAAYICDEQTADMIRPICTELGWPSEKVHKGGLRNAVQSLSVSASPIILFVDLSESGDPLNDINALAEVCEPGTVVIATGQVNDVRLYRDLLASGIQDYLLKPFSPDQLRDTLANAQNYLNAPRHVEAQIERPHIMTAVIGVRGGVGASMVSSSLAWIFSEKERRSTALLDLDVSGVPSEIQVQVHRQDPGEAAPLLLLRPKRPPRARVFLRGEGAQGPEPRGPAQALPRDLGEARLPRRRPGGRVLRGRAADPHAFPR